MPILAFFVGVEGPGCDWLGWLLNKLVDPEKFSRENMELLERTLVPGPKDISLESDALLTCACMPDMTGSFEELTPD